MSRPLLRLPFSALSSELKHSRRLVSVLVLGSILLQSYLTSDSRFYLYLYNRLDSVNGIKTHTPATTTSTPHQSKVFMTTEAKVDKAVPGANYVEQLQKFEQSWKELSSDQPAFTSAFWKLRSAVRQPGALDTKTKELIAIAISVARNCDGCLAHHVYDALEAGATREEITDALGVAVLMCGGTGVVYATHALEALDQFSAASSETN